MGGIAEVYMHDGMNDCPPLEEAIANAHLIAASPNLLAVALRYEAWEARFALCDDCWKSGLTQIPLELLEELRDIQKDRNVAVAKALAKARAP
jgi:hypothetical protein